MTNNRIRIFLADDHKMLRESLVMLLSQEEDFDITGNAADGIEMMQKLYELKGAVDVVLLDISMPRKGGFETARDIKSSFPEVKIIYLTMHKSEEIVAEAFESGADGYILKENAFEELVDAIRKVIAGDVYISSVIAPLLLDGFIANEKRTKDLSAREREVLKLLAEGYSNKEIADFLSISIKTVETHRANIMRKHSFKNITELVLYAVRNHIIEV